MTKETPKAPQGSVVIVGAGTQGRRLAYMVSTMSPEHGKFVPSDIDE